MSTFRSKGKAVVTLRPPSEPTACWEEAGQSPCCSVTHQDPRSLKGKLLSDIYLVYSINKNLPVSCSQNSELLVTQALQMLPPGKARGRPSFHLENQEPYSSKRF